MSEEIKEYKDTLNLPQTTLEMRANAVNKEPKTQLWWDENKIYEKILTNMTKQTDLSCTTVRHT